MGLGNKKASYLFLEYSCKKEIGIVVYISIFLKKGENGREKEITSASIIKIKLGKFHQVLRSVTRWCIPGP